LNEVIILWKICIFFCSFGGMNIVSRSSWICDDSR